MPEQQLVEVERRDAVAVVHLRRPPLNVLCQAMVVELAATARELSRDTAVRAVVLWGGRHFSAGADVEEFATMTVADVHAYGTDLDAAFRGLAALPQVTIAAVNGYALGGGCELAMTADLRFAGDRATFALPEIQLGLIPGAGGTQRLPLLVGAGRAKELIYTGRHVKAEEAQAIGLANAVFPAGELLEQAVAAATRYAAGPTVALRAAKAAIDRATGASAEGLDLERTLFSLLFGTEDWQRGATSFKDQGPGKATFVGR